MSNSNATYVPVDDAEHMLRLKELRDLTAEQLLDGVRNESYKGSAAKLEILTRVTKQIEEIEARQGSQSVAGSIEIVWVDPMEKHAGRTLGTA